jgi:hypothetical protein
MLRPPVLSQPPTVGKSNDCTRLPVDQGGSRRLGQRDQAGLGRRLACGVRVGFLARAARGFDDRPLQATGQRGDIRRG